MAFTVLCFIGYSSFSAKLYWQFYFKIHHFNCKIDTNQVCNCMSCLSIHMNTITQESLTTYHTSQTGLILSVIQTLTLLPLQMVGFQTSYDLWRSRKPSIQMLLSMVRLYVGACTYVHFVSKCCGTCWQLDKSKIERKTHLCTYTRMIQMKRYN